MSAHTDMSYEEWDALRRERFRPHPKFKDVTVIHNEHETCLFYFETGTSAAAVWNTHSGTCHVLSEEEAAESVLRLAKNYIVNSLTACPTQDTRSC